MSGSLAAICVQGFDSQALPPGTLSHSAAAAAYRKLSDIRTVTSSKRKRTETDNAERPKQVAGEASQRIEQDSMPPIRTRHTSRQPLGDDCSNLVIDCDGKECRLPQRPTSDECTDQCVVVPCNDLTECTKLCTQEKCSVEPCEGGDACTGGFEEIFQCCTKMHSSETPDGQKVPQINLSTPEDFWNFRFEDQQQLQVQSLLSQLTDSNVFQVPPIFPDVSGALDIFSQQPDPSMNFAPSSQQAPATALATYQSMTSEPLTNSEFKCRWDSCNASFSSLNELVGHVNVSHLCGPAQTMPASKPDATTASLFKQVVEPLACHWDQCHTFSNSSTLPGPSSGLQLDAAMDQLTSHLFLDHLGISVPHCQIMLQNSSAKDHTAQSLLADFLERQSQEGTSSQKTIDLRPQQPPNPASQFQLPSPSALTYSTPAPSPPPLASSSDSPHDCAATTHICHWKSCGLSFDTCAALTEHLNASHVGGGRSRYDCHWGDCARSGAAGFASKQKIMRHLQAHTGHRPFTCSECGLHFSEAATLQQHMRRHTQEKPFVCDFPGCGKAFAITGALTIHKRTHNGERPFKCPHCSRAFAESSNLSKHLRTHTGDKPYCCPEPGCGKAFARPDQLQRHGNVHNKKKTALSPAEPAEPSDVSSSG